MTLGVLPIESSLVGPIAETHDLLYGSALSIVREATLPIRHCVLGLPGASSSGRRPSGRIPPRSTSAASCSGRATSAACRPRPPPTRRATVAEGGDPSQLAIASTEAAVAYGLEVLADDVGDRPGAFTRFVALAPYTPARQRRRLAHRALVRHRPPAGSALPRARPARAQRRQPGAARLAAAPELAVALPFRRGARRSRLRSRRSGLRSLELRGLTRELRLFGSYSAEVAR